MGFKVTFSPDGNVSCAGRGTELTGLYLKNKEEFWNHFMNATEQNVYLSAVLHDLGYDNNTLARMLTRQDFDNLDRSFWSFADRDVIDFGITFDEKGEFLLNFNCRLADKTEEDSEPKAEQKKRCYFWKVYKYHVDISEITLRGWVDWCNELYQIQHGKPRPKNNRIFVSPDMMTATVKGRFWNKDRIEKWLTNHGYSWTQTVETKYQWPVKEGEDVELVDSDAELKARKSA